MEATKTSFRQSVPKLIFCQGGNLYFYRVSQEIGFEYGSRLPDTIYGKIYFADQDFKNPDRISYMKCLNEHRPHMATVLDITSKETFIEAMSWAEEVSQYVECVILIPKVARFIGDIPKSINSKRVVLGYSVPTKYGGTPIHISCFAGRPVHLLGGSTQLQYEFWIRLKEIADVISLDGNMASKMATRNCQVWYPGNANFAQNRYWPTIKEIAGKRIELKDAHKVAFKLSMQNIYNFWKCVERGFPLPEVRMKRFSRAINSLISQFYTPSVF